MRDYIGLGPAPADENPVQTGYDRGDWAQARAESARYKFQVIRQFGDLASELGVPLDVRIKVEHGEYIDVIVWFEWDNKTQVNLAFFIEENVSSRWGDVVPATKEEFDLYWQSAN